MEPDRPNLGRRQQPGVRGVQVPQTIERFSSWVGAGVGGVEYEDGLHDRGRAAWAAAQLGQDSPGLERGDGAFAQAAARSTAVFKSAARAASKSTVRRT